MPELRTKRARARGGGAVSLLPATPSLLYSVKQVELAIRAQLDELLKPWRVTALQYTALAVLDQRNDLTAAELARNSFVRMQSMADLVGSLERSGLVRRQRDVKDRRRWLISLTPDGRQLLSEASGEVAALEALMITGLSARTVEELRVGLDTCRRNLAGPPAERRSAPSADK